MTNDKQQLIYNIDKRFKTTMIGSLAQFEEKFSHLWNDMDEDRKKYYADLWEETRDEILNNGNHQSRCAIKELKTFLFPNRVSQKYNFKFRGDE